MKDGIIFVAGIYGVGKSTLCERLGLSIGITSVFLINHLMLQGCLSLFFR